VGNGAQAVGVRSAAPPSSPAAQGGLAGTGVAGRAALMRAVATVTCQERRAAAMGSLKRMTGRSGGGSVGTAASRQMQAGVCSSLGVAETRPCCPQAYTGRGGVGGVSSGGEGEELVSSQGSRE
jgi:hypothetical protein